MRRRAFLGVGGGTVALLAGCTARRVVTVPAISLLVPSTPGGRGEAFARALKGLLEKRRLTRDVRIRTRPGGDGTLALVEFAGARGTGELMIASPALVAVATMRRTAGLLRGAVPIARLAGEWQVLVTPSGSPFHTFDDLATALLRDPARPHMAGQGAGGPDHVLYGLIAQGLGIDARLLTYLPFADCAQVVAAALDGRVEIGLGGCRELSAEIRSGRLRPLAVSSGQRLPGLDVPTLRESGVRLEYANWTGLLGHGRLAERERVALLDVCAAVGDEPGWEVACARNGWLPMYQAGDDFRLWLDNEVRRTRVALKDLGLL